MQVYEIHQDRYDDFEDALLWMILVNRAIHSNGGA